MKFVVANSKAGCDGVDAAGDLDHDFVIEV